MINRTSNITCIAEAAVNAGRAGEPDVDWSQNGPASLKQAFIPKNGFQMLGEL
jgi:hypothetical protein